MSKFTNSQNIALPLAVWLAHDTYKGIKAPNAISATSLMKPLKETILAARLENGGGDVDIATRKASAKGTAYHNAIEAAWKSEDLPQILESLSVPKRVRENIRINPKEHDPDVLNIYLEKRSERQLGNWMINGMYDLVFDGEVHDYKSTGTYGYVKGNKVDDYILQGSIYRWLNPEIITADTITIHYIFTDWSKLESIKKKEYPQSDMISKQYRLLGLSETQAWINSRLAILSGFATLPEEELPPCTDKELWRGPPTFKYYKNPNSTNRSTANFTDQNKAFNRLAEDGHVGIVKVVHDTPKRCNFCTALAGCEQARSYINQGILKI